MEIRINLAVRGTMCTAELEQQFPITTGCRGVFRAVLHADSSWDGMDTTVVFRAGQISRSQHIGIDGTSCLVPPEVLAERAPYLEIGVYGTAGEDVVRTTTWARLHGIVPGAVPTGDAMESPDLYAQLLARLNATVKTVNGHVPDENGNVTVEVGGGGAGTPGGYYTPTVTQPDENTMRVSYTPSDSSMPAVESSDVTLPDGADGKSAYQYAVEGGYTGTEAEFSAKMAAEILTVDSTLTQSGQAADAAAVRKELDSLSEEIVTTSESKVSAHNTGADTHGDIRLLIQGLTDRLNALADSDDTTLDQLSEVVAYIKSNRDLISSITTDKVSVADIVDNLTTNVANKPLSAAQGVALKALIDAISVPDKLPNPNALTFTGAVTGSYDGSAPLEVEIPTVDDVLAALPAWEGGSY